MPDRAIGAQIEGSARYWDDPMTLDAFFSGREESRRIFDTLRAAIDALGPADLRVTKS